MSHDVRFLGPDDLRAAHHLFASALLHAPLDDAAWASAGAASYAPGRTLGVHGADGTTLVSTATSFPTTTAVPGGELPTAAVTRVGVRADHTRRGLLTALMRAQLEDVAERGEVLASLRASEARIYGRFGYGVASRGRSVRVRRSGLGWRAGAPAGGTVRLIDAAEIPAVVAPLHDRLARCRTGGISRTAGWWGSVLTRLTDTHAVLAAVHTGPDGDDGFALAVPSDGETFGRATLAVKDLHAAGPGATAGLWRFLLDVDLVGAVEADLRPLDEPLELLLADPRDCTVTGVDDETWLRIVDVPAALAARSWGEAEPVLLGVHDPLLHANSGVYRIGDGAAERTTGTADLECGVAALAMAYLGDRRPSELAATGWWTGHDPKALARADAAFSTGTVPWCGTFF